MQWSNNSTILISLIIIILVAGLGVIHIAGINVPYLNWVDNSLFYLVSPLIEFTAGIYHQAARYWDGITNINSILRENEQLQDKVYQLEREKQMMYQLSNENQRLRELLGFKERVPYETKGARVIGYSPLNWENKAIINLGSSDGIKKRMPVISYNGALVGRVDYVGVHSSQVILINNPDFVVGGIVQRSGSRAIGLVKGQLNNNRIDIMEDISWNTESQAGDVKKGDTIVTSGLSNSYPLGLPIGRVTSVEKDNYGLSQKAEIELFMSLKTIEEVLVITDFE